MIERHRSHISFFAVNSLLKLFEPPDDKNITTCPYCQHHSLHVCQPFSLVCDWLFCTNCGISKDIIRLAANQLGTTWQNIVYEIKTILKESYSLQFTKQLSYIFKYQEKALKGKKKRFTTNEADASLLAPLGIRPPSNLAWLSRARKFYQPSTSFHLYIKNANSLYKSKRGIMLPCQLVPGFDTGGIYIDPYRRFIYIPYVHTFFRLGMQHDCGLAFCDIFLNPKLQKIDDLVIITHPITALTLQIANCRENSNPLPVLGFIDKYVTNDRSWTRPTAIWNSLLDKQFLFVLPPSFLGAAQIKSMSLSSAKVWLGSVDDSAIAMPIPWLRKAWKEAVDWPEAVAYVLERYSNENAAKTITAANIGAELTEHVLSYMSSKKQAAIRDTMKVKTPRTVLIDFISITNQKHSWIIDGTIITPKFNVDYLVKDNNCVYFIGKRHDKQKTPIRAYTEEEFLTKVKISYTRNGYLLYNSVHKNYIFPSACAFCPPVKINARNIGWDRRSRTFLMPTFRVTHHGEIIVEYSPLKQTSPCWDFPAPPTLLISPSYFRKQENILPIVRQLAKICKDCLISNYFSVPGTRLRITTNEQLIYTKKLFSQIGCTFVTKFSEAKKADKHAWPYVIGTELSKEQLQKLNGTFIFYDPNNKFSEYEELKIQHIPYTEYLLWYCIWKAICAYLKQTKDFRQYEAQYS